MKLNAKIESNILDNKHKAHITLLIENYRQAHDIQSLDSDKLYKIEIVEAKSKRSISQNNLMWALLHELEKVTDESMMNWYHKSLIDARAKVEYLIGTDEMFETLVTFKDFRSVKIVGKRMVTNKDNVEIEMNVYELIMGTSKMNIKEMNMVIDIVLGYCAEFNLDIEALKYE